MDWKFIFKMVVIFFASMGAGDLLVRIFPGGDFGFIKDCLSVGFLVGAGFWIAKLIIDILRGK